MNGSADATRNVPEGVTSAIANALNLSPSKVRLSKSLVQLGGDSLDAIEIARLCYDQGIALQAHQILGASSIAETISLARRDDSPKRRPHDPEDAPSEPFALLPAGDVDDIVAEVRSQCGLAAHHAVEEAFPCTPLQEGFMALSLKQPGSYIQKMTYKLSRDVNPAQFKAAWERTVEVCGNLRTRIVLFGGVPVQAALRGDESWEPSGSLRLASLSEDLGRIRMTFGSRLCRYALLQDGDGSHYFVWVIHHSVFDGWVQQLVLDTLAKVFHEQNPTVTPFSGFIKYTTDLDRDASRRYWNQQLDGARSASWPSVPSSRTAKPEIRTLRKTIDFSSHQNATVTKASVLRAAWAIVLARYSDTRDICFGTVASGRNAPVRGLSRMAGPTLATVPVRMTLDEGKSVVRFLQDVQTQALDAIPHEQYGLQNIAKLGRDAENACGFTSLMVVQPYTAAASAGGVFESELLGADETLQGYFDYPLVAQALLGEQESAELLLAYDSGILGEARLKILGDHFDHVVQQLRTAGPDATLGSVSVSGPSDLEKASAWGRQRYQLVEDCVHDLISSQAAEIPEHVALYSSETTLTYAQLDTLSTNFAGQLIQLGLSPGDAVAFCLEKSVWAVVALLAILKAGGSFTPLDPSHPQSRRQEICDLVGAEFIIASPSTAGQCGNIASNLVTLDPDSLSTLPGPASPLPTILPDHTAYIIFTSGSTGKPKGIVIPHSAFSTSVRGMVDMLGFTGESRTLQFSNYVFDASTLEIFPTLVAGGTLCVPTDTGRLQNTAGFITESEANAVFLTPSFAQTLSPEEVPTVKTLIVGGEAPVRDTLDRWHGFVKLINAYGPSEVCVMCNFYEYPTKDALPTTIGQGLSHTSWIVEADDPQMLAPVGCVGELLIQGHALASGYLNDDARTKEAFLEDVRWIPPALAANGTRFYRTGDLVRQNLDGTLEFLGRKDTQVKVRGQRLELGEVEDRMKKVAPEIKHAAADVITNDERQALVAFISFESGGTEDESSLFMPIDDPMREFFASLSAGLKNELPGYMVPTVFFPLYEMPIMAGSMKLDRGRLRALANELSAGEMAEYTLASRNKVSPVTEIEFRIRDLWSTVLGLSAEEIGRHDDFLQIGGDSISAIKLAAQARKQNLQLSVGDIFDNSQLVAMAAIAVELEDSAVDEYTPFSIVASDKDGLIDEARSQCRLSASAEIEDIYPCTAFQEGLMALAVKQPGTYIAKYLYRIQNGADLDRLRAAWEQTMDRCENLRTRIVSVRGESFQILTKNDVYWELTQNVDLASFKSASQILQMNYGSRLNRYGIIEEAPGEMYFFWISHHAVFDGWTVGLVLDTFFQAYETMEAPKLQPYASFIQHLSQTSTNDATSYWKEQLENAQRASFPALPSTSNKDKSTSTRTMQTTIEFPQTTNLSITKATILRAAWAIILGRYGDNTDVTFGSSVSGRNASLPELQNMPGPAVATVPVRVRLEGENSSVLAFLKGIQDQALKMVAYEQFGLQNIAKLSPEAKEACDFSSLLVVQPLQKHLSLDREDNKVLSEVSGKVAEDSMEGYFTYPLVIQAHLLDDAVELHLTYDAEILSNTQVQALSHHFDHVTHQLLENINGTLGDISVAGPWDLQQAIRWNSETPKVINACIHELLEKQAAIRPDAPAVCAWDFELSYRQLNEAANRLGHYLVDNYGIQTGDYVLACFEKSAWYMVAIMAINKAGGAWVPIDPAHPTSRHQQIASQTGARLILASSSCAEFCKRVVDDVIEVSASLDRELQADPIKSTLSPKTTVSPSDPAYVLFTSGSTGVPKGLIMEHRGACSAQAAIGGRLGMMPDARMLQFAAFVFDFSIGEIVGPLVYGASICIPSDEARMNDIQGFIREKNVTWTYLTPAFAKTLQPSEVPSLEVLLLGGEAVTQDLFDRWFGKLRFFNGWGPAETCCLSSAHEWTSSTESPLTIGTPMGAYLWLTEVNNPNKLAPIGTLGEVIIQGPGVMRGYMGLPEQTSKTMLDSPPAWVPEETLAISSRFYRTGDLCYYKPDGTIEFYSRNDTQVKIRGLRIELGEIEHNFGAALPGVCQIAVDTFKPEGALGDPKLVAYFCMSNDTRNTSLLGGDACDTFLPLSSDFRDNLGSAIGELNVKLPSYMVPTIFIPCRYMPVNTSTKIDRRGLKAMTATLSQDDISAYSLVSGTKRPPATALEARMQTIWAEILNLPAESIGRDDSFLRIGGDSITAIRLVAVARDAGYLLTVKDIFADPRLSSIASKCEAVEGSRTEELLAAIPPFGLLDDAQREVVIGETEKQCALSPDQTVQDAYPCNPLQEGFMLSSLKNPGSYIAKWAFKIGQHVDIDRFKSAWEATLQHCPNLRTRVIQIGDASVQTILSDDNEWEDTEGLSLRDYLNQANTFNMTYGSRLNRYGIVRESEGETYFAWIVHHSIYDGWTMRLVFHTMTRIYQSEDPAPLMPYVNFIKYADEMDKEAAREYWGWQLKDAIRAAYPASTKQLDRLEHEAHAQAVKATIEYSQSNTSITQASLVRAAWAIVLARYCDTHDVCFGTAISGRQAPVPGLEEMPGPMVATLPIRIRLDSQQSVSEYLQTIQDQATDMITYEQFGIQNIANISQEAKEACDFSSLLVIEPAEEFVEDDSDNLLSTPNEDKWNLTDSIEGYSDIPLVLKAQIGPDRIDLSYIYRGGVLDENEVTALSHQLEHVIKQLSQGDDDTPVQDVSVAGPWDLERAKVLTGTPIRVEACAHDLITRKAASSPDRQAIFSSEVIMTYADLDRLSNQLAGYLSSLGVGLGKPVPICYEKSPWVIVYMVSIMKAGGVYVPFDPEHPLERRRDLVGDLGAEYLIVSPSTAEDCKGLTPNNIIIDPAKFSMYEEYENHERAKVTPQDVAFILFTSGSTGKPKGVVMEHGTLCSSCIMGFGKSFGGGDFRVLQFSNYVFDVSIAETFGVFLAGGTVCVPNETERLQETTKFINAARVDIAILTPSFARALDPAKLPTLRKLVLGGEPLTKDTMEQWFDHVELLNAYGPAEACVCSNVHVFQTKQETSSNIGNAVNASLWIVEPDDHERLAPIGCVGELVIQGNVARGYLNNEAQTQKAFIDSVSWLPDAGPARFYKTGDLVKYKSNGDMEIFGRKDTQVKIRGQRMESGEIEYMIKKVHPKVSHVAVDVIRHKSRQTLVAFLGFSDDDYMKKQTGGFFFINDDLRQSIATLAAQLGTVLPGYMVPSLFLPVRSMPFISALKLDRKKLREQGNALTQEEVAEFYLTSRQMVQPVNDAEATLRDVWAQVLHVEPETISTTDSFLEIGGNSISAIQLVSLAQQHGIMFTASDVFTDARLTTLAALGSSGRNSESFETEPFALIEEGDLERVKAEVTGTCLLRADQIIQDVYPAAPIQQGLMALSVKQPGSYIAKNIYKLSEDVDVDRFRTAWERTAELCTNLRTRIIQTATAQIQAIVSNDIEWEDFEGQDLPAIWEAGTKVAMTYGSRLNRYALATDTQGAKYFIWFSHHSVFDGWLVGLVLETLKRVYTEADLPRLSSYANFVSWVSQMDPSNAEDYWRGQLRGAQQAKFPPPKPLGAQPSITRHVKKLMAIPENHGLPVTTATLLRGAWAMLLARYCDTEDVTFGATVSGRNAPVAGVDVMPGVMIATVPVRVQIKSLQRVKDYLQSIQDQSSEMIAFEQYGLHNISKLDATIKEACDFTSLMVIQPAQQMGLDGEDKTLFSPVDVKEEGLEDGMQGYFSYPLVMQCLMMDGKIELHLTYDATILMDEQLQAMAHQYETTVNELIKHSDWRVGDIEMTSAWDIEKAKEFNSVVPKAIESTIHKEIERQAHIRPNAQAIYAWDGQFTYAELDAAANRLANYLVSECSVKVGDIIHVCFDKSAWHLVSVLAVNKAGAAWSPIDPTHPLQRKQQITKQTQAKILLTSPEYAALGTELAESVVQVTPALISDLSEKHPASAPNVQVTPDNVAYVLFTSGSTGVPKGFVIRHRSLCTCQHSSNERLGLDSSVRMLQFAAFVFDLSIGEIFGPLIRGACVCIPSEKQRMNSIREFIRDSRASWAYLTPAYARVLRPESVPSLKLLMFAGEAVPRDVFELWFGKVRLINAWGPAEASTFSSFYEYQSWNDSSATIGKPVGNFCWIVDPEDPSKLAPIGTAGEVVIQGPTLLKEYISDPEKTAASTVSNLPEWAPYRESKLFSHFFKSGDLCYYNPDGTMEFISRKDTQVKIRGLRVELGEVEHHIISAMDDASQVVVDVLRNDAGTHLVAYFTWTMDTRTGGVNLDPSMRDMFGKVTPDLTSQLTAVVGALRITLPGYMVPSVFIPCRYLPLNTSAKVDRKALRQHTKTLTREELQGYALVSGEKRPPETPMERHLQAIWADILDLTLDSIGRDDSFLRIGGDSIAVTRLISLAADQGIQLTAKNVFDDPRLCSVSAKATFVQPGESDAPYQPFDILDKAGREFVYDGEMEKQYGLDPARVVDAYPCTPLQDGLIALSMKQPGSYITRYLFNIPPGIDRERLRQAWERTVDKSPNLHTRIIKTRHSTLQVLIEDDKSWEDATGMDVETFVKLTNSYEMTYGSRLCRYAFISQASGDYLMWICHHSVIDGWSIRIVQEMLQAEYWGTETPAIEPYPRLVKYTQTTHNEATREFWRNQLEGAEPLAFPPKPHDPDAEFGAQIENIPIPDNADSSVTKASLLRAAWSIILASHNGSREATFGATVSGRNAPVPGIQNMAGPAIATVPVRIRQDPEMALSDFLHGVQTQASDMTAYEQFGMHNIARLGQDEKEACDFNSLIVIQPNAFAGPSAKTVITHGDYEHQATSQQMGNFFNYPLVLLTILHETHYEVRFFYNPASVDKARVEAIGHQLRHVLQQLALPAEGRLLGDIRVSGDWDYYRALEYHLEPPLLVDETFPILVDRQATLRPDAMAVRTADRSLTFRGLNECANRVANYLLQEFTIKPAELIQVCFEKSAWYVVAILAINKAGAAWVPLDPSHPRQRHEEIVRQTGARLVLTSALNGSICEGLVESVVQLTPELDETLRDGDYSSGAPSVVVSPRDPMYVLFTSGSTGTPKGIVMEHGSVCTSQVDIAKRLGLAPGVNILQFSAFVFDVSVGEIVGPLITGATVSIPSDHVRLNSLAQFINDMEVSWAYLTPAFARTLKPTAVPNLELLLLAGEAVGNDVFETWYGHVRLVNGYGPAETCCFSILHEWKTPTESPLTIGRPVGGFCWIVDPDDATRLAPIGTEGEIIIQGPTLLREYLGDPDKTAKSTITDLPEWAPKRDSLPWSRAFKSGDLGSYNADGSIRFSSRKDTQVKIRGLRIELGEIEHHIQASLPTMLQIAVDVYASETKSQLVAFICDNDKKLGGEHADLFSELSQDLKDQISTLLGKMSVSLPQYMIPSIFIPCKYMPVITSGKLDRKTLRALASKLSSEDVVPYTLSYGVKRATETPMEARLQKIWAKILYLPLESIGRDDNFLRIGGDSINAIELVSAANDEGILITTDDIFNDPRLCALAEVATEKDDDNEPEYEPFSLIEGRISRESIDQYGYDIEDAYPCTPLQEGLMALSERQPGSYMAKHTFKLLDTVDIERFQEAWEETMELCPNLRTRIVMADNVPVQVHVTDDTQWEDTEGHTLQSFMKSTKNMRMTYDTRLCRYALIEEDDEHYFVWICHHTVFDGWTMRLILGTLFTAYNDSLGLNLQPYARFIEHTLNVDEEAAKDYWRGQLRGVNRATYPPTAKPETKTGQGMRILNRSVDFPVGSDSTITKGTLLRASWAIVLASYCETDDVCFGTTVSGRQTPVVGVAEMPGPMVGTVPVRVRLDGDKTITDFLEGVQKQSTQMVPYEQYGLQNISRLGADIREACDFSSLLVIQPFRKMFTPTEDDDEQMWEEVDEDMNDGKISESYADFVNYPLVVQGHVSNTGLDLSLIYDADVLSEAQMDALAHHFNHVVQGLVADGSQPLSSLSVAGKWDLETASAWNSAAFDIEETVEMCVHHLISKQAANVPDIPALLSTEATITFAQLATYSDAFANHLISLGVRPNTRVPFCVVKSIWGIVAMVGILKAGGTFIPLDPGHPYDRRQGLMEQLGAEHLIVSPTTAESCDGLAKHTIELSPSFIGDLVRRYNGQIPNVDVSPRDGAYILFTSGTTGQPKGIVIEHGPLCTSLTGQSTQIQFDTTTRMIQFGSFTFDACIAEIFTTLISGGGVCVPTDAERNQAPEFMTRFGVTTALLTPSFVRTFSPEDVPHLHTLVVLGEAPSKDIMDTWVGRVNLMNAYGPTEVCMCNATQMFKSSDAPTTIGTGFVHHNWIVDPKDHNKLAPIGSVGELLVQGYALARGYLNDEEKTNNSFIDSVAWMPESKHRFYKTGDLVRYNLDGTIQYCARKDTQVKVRGQRVELGEIESAILESLPSVENAVADVIKVDERQTLVAFLSFNDKSLTPSNESSAFASLDENLQNVVGGLAQALQARLPGYMVPTFYLPVAKMPFVQAMKVDRKKLRADATALSMTHLGLFTADTRVKVEPTTDMEFRLRDVWAQILGVSADTIGKHDNFLQIGGDSISAIKLASLAQSRGFGLTVADIFKDSRLSTMATTLASGVKYESLDVDPFSQVSSDVIAAVMGEVERYDDESGTIQGIEEISPTHITQDAFIAGSTKFPGTLQARRVLRIPQHVDVERFKAAWDSLVQHFGILRSRIYLVGEESYLAVLKEKPEWEDVKGYSGVREYLKAQEGGEYNMTYGSRLHRQAIIEEEGEHYFVWIQHHCIADGWTFGLVMNALQQFYEGAAPPPAGQYSGFVKFARNVDTQGAADFWSRHLDGVRQTTWPQPLRSDTPYKGGVTETLSRGIQLPSLDASITPATIMTGAWALALSKRDESADVSFTRTSSGRQAPLEGLETVAGLTTARVPVRVRIDRDISIAQFLSDIQATAAESVPFEHFGSKNIANLLSPESAPAVLQPTSLLLLQPAKHLDMETSEDKALMVPAADKLSGAEALDGFYIMPLVTDCFLGDDRIDLHSAYNRHVVSKAEIEAFHEELERMILHLCTSPGEVVGSAFA